MKIPWRQFRAYVFLVSLWSLVSIVAATVFILATSRNPFESTDATVEFLVAIAFSGFAGVISGNLFSVLFMTLERGRSFTQLSLVRTAVWGAAAGAMLSLALSLFVGRSVHDFQLTDVLQSLWIFSAVCSIGAVSLLALARRGKVLSGSLEDVAAFSAEETRAPRTLS